MKHIIIEEISKSYGNNEVLKNLNLEIDKGSFVTFLGPNACGKTTLLNIVSGLIKHDSGSVAINNKKPIKVGYVYQNSHKTLFPWKKVIDNIAFPLELEGLSKLKRYKKVREFLEKFEIVLPLDIYPYQLSGGQQRMVAIARSLINKPDILIMDEPFDGLDYKTRINTQNKILEMWLKLRPTILFVSHSIDEIILLSQKIVLFGKEKGNILKIIENNLPYLRNYQLMADKSFIEIKKNILETFIRKEETK